MGKRTLAQVGLAAMERLDLPGELAGGIPQLELVGSSEFYMARHKGVLSYSTEEVQISGEGMVVRLLGHELQLVAMTEDELRIAGHITGLELVE